MRTYQCKLTYKGFVKENFFREAESEITLLGELRAFAYDRGTWKIYLNDELMISGSS